MQKKTNRNNSLWSGFSTHSMTFTDYMSRKAEKHRQLARGELRRGIDRTREVSKEEFAAAEALGFSAESLRDCNFYIVTVPTPVDHAKRPDLSALIGASRMVGERALARHVVVYESTVYPGATEEICVPALEKTSGFRFNRDFFAGYSPERINPGDKTHRLPDIVPARPPRQPTWSTGSMPW